MDDDFGTFANLADLSYLDDIPNAALSPGAVIRSPITDSNETVVASPQRSHSQHSLRSQIAPRQIDNPKDDSGSFFHQWKPWKIPGQDGHVIKVFKYDLSESKDVWIANGFHYSLGRQGKSKDVSFAAISHCWLPDKEKPGPFQENYNELSRWNHSGDETIQSFFNDPGVMIWKKNRVLRTCDILSQLRDSHDFKLDWFWMDLVSIDQRNAFAIRDASYVMSYVYHTAACTVVLKQVKNKELDKHWDLLSLLQLSFARSCHETFKQDHVYCIRGFSKAVYDRPVVYTLALEVLIAECAVSAAQNGDFSMFNAFPAKQSHGFGMIHPVWEAPKLGAQVAAGGSALARYSPTRVIPCVGFEFKGRLSDEFDIRMLDKVQLAGQFTQTWASTLVHLSWSHKWCPDDYNTISPFRLDMINAFMASKVPCIKGPFYTKVSKFMESVARLMDVYVSPGLKQKILEEGVTFEEALSWKVEGRKPQLDGVGFLHELERVAVHNYLMVGPLMFHHAQCLCQFCTAATQALVFAKNGDLEMSLAFSKAVFADRVSFGMEWRKLVPNFIPALQNSPTAAVVLVWLYLELGFVEPPPPTKSKNQPSAIMRQVIFSVSHTGVLLPFLRNVEPYACDFVQDPDDPLNCKIMTLQMTKNKFGSTPIYHRIGSVKDQVHNLASIVSFRDGCPRAATLDELRKAYSKFPPVLKYSTIVVDN
ncbi:hypothetical protein HDU98_001810 [Podochytrium sp. JEL0797]|nr:hypothetical protein HDU98_001810 [Podochytrium sp. JEL0797]